MWPLQPTTGFHLIDYMPPSEIGLVRCVEMPQPLPVEACAAASRCAGMKRAEGFHALRHFYASVLLDAGESIKALAECLGHADPGFTLRTYTHLMPASSEHTRRAVDGVLQLVDPEYAENPEPEPGGRGRRASDGLIMRFQSETAGQNSSVIRRRSRGRTRRGAGAAAGDRSRFRA
jgi:hypothetical protein